MNHLRPDEFIDAIDETLPRARHAHVADCEECRDRVVQMAALLSEVRRGDVPDPSPLFWDVFSDRVRRAIAGEPAVPPQGARWFQWPVLVPVGALAALVLALASTVPSRVGVIDNQTAIGTLEIAPDTDVSSDLDAHWELIAELVGDVDFDAASQAGVRTLPGAVDDVVMQLSATEQQELARLLREELERSGG